MNELKKRLKSGKIDKVYVLSGTEPYLIRAYEKQLREAVTGTEPSLAELNTSVFEDGGHKPADIISTSETPPFLTEKRLIILKNSGFLQTSKKDDPDSGESSASTYDANALYEYIPHMPDSSVIIFTEPNKIPDKRGRLYKKISSEGLAVEFITPKEHELSSWLIKLFRSKGISMPPQTASFMLRYVCGSSESIMDNLYTEANKLISYLGNRREAASADVESICSPCLEGHIFGLVKEISSKNQGALTTLGNLIAMKEQPLRILSMITRQFRLMLLCKGLREKGLGSSEIIIKTGLRDFMVTDFLRQSSNFTQETLVNALNDCLTVEFNIKSGKMPDKLAIETLIIKYLSL